VLAKLRELRDQRDRGLNLAERRRTVAEWLDEWLSEVKAHDETRPATITLYCGLADHWVKPVIGSVKLDRLTPAHVQSR